MKKIIFLIAFIGFGLNVQAKIVLPAIFGDNMVLQQQSDVSIWGWGKPAETVKIVPGWQTGDTVAVKVSGEGVWRARIRTIGAGGPYTLQVFVSATDKTVVNNVMLGEVWLCSGQSNMGWSAAENLVNKEAEIAAANHPDIRIFHVPARTATSPQVNCDAQWAGCTPTTMQRTSAVGYFFARRLKEYLNVPVGIIVAAWGGTPYETWTKKELIDSHPLLKVYAPVNENEWRPNLPGSCYNQMIHPLVPYSISGAIWYQGETNVGHPYYATGLQTMINGWRTDFGKEFPFYLVQIAPYTYNSTFNEPALLREQQELVTKSVPRTGMVVVSDLVHDIKDIHPIDKQNVGLRLANLALAETYHQPVRGYLSPVFNSMRIEKGKAIITFDNAQDGLMVKGKKITGLKIAGADKKFVEAEGTVRGDKLVVASPKVKQPVHVTFCFDDSTVGNLFSKAGLPVAPFRTKPVNPASELIVSSPDTLLKVKVLSEKGRLYYTASYNGKTILEDSPLGLITSTGDFSKEMKLIHSSYEKLDETYTLQRAKKSAFHYKANQLKCTFSNTNDQQMELIFHVSNNDIAFCYALKDQGESAACIVEKEITGFNFPSETTTFLTPQAAPMTFWKRTKPSYEEEYAADEPIGTPSKYGLGYTFPGLFRVGEHWALVSETGVTGAYCASRLSEATSDGIYTVVFPDERENNGIGNASPVVSLPATTPWRTITIADHLKPIVETTIPFDVVQPLYEPSIEYKSGRSTWSWIMWQDESMNWNDQVAYIDFAALMGYEYILMDALWDERIGYDGMEKLVNYARSKGVDVFLWYNSNGVWNDAPQSPKNKLNTALARKQEMKWLKQAGVKGLKVDFFGGDKQQTMQLYQDILADANEHGLMIIFHGCTLPRGWERMYPNFVGSEAVLASENLIFTQHACDTEAYNATLHPFIRNAVGSMEFGPVLLNERLNRNNDGGTIRRTTDIFQIATAVLFQSPVQMFAIAPNNLTDAPWFVMDFMMSVPTTWDETVFIDGYPGKYCVLARRSGEKWYVTGVNAQKELCRIKVKLPMLEGKTFMKYYDDKDRKAHAERMTLHQGEEVILEIQPDGGIVLATPYEQLWNSEQSKNADFQQKATGEHFSSSTLQTYVVPDAYPQEGAALYTVAVNGKYTGVYTDLNAWKELVSFGYFDFKQGNEVEIRVTAAKPFSGYKILPESNPIRSQREGQTISFTLKDADRFLSIVFDDDYKGSTLHLFANSIDQNAPVKGDNQLIYFGPGYHQLESPLKIPAGTDVYIAGGAVVNGNIELRNNQGSSIKGRGILMSTVPGGLVLGVSHSSDIQLEGIIVCSHRNPGWTVGLHQVSNARADKLKIVSPRYASTDGFDISNSNHIRIRNCFVRTCDDAIAIKGLVKGSPADCPPNEHLYFENLQLWNDCNNAMCLGAETRASKYENIHFSNIDVLSSYDDKYHHGKLDERAVMTIVSLEGTYFNNISWENIRVNRCERLICLTFKDQFWFGSIQGDQSTEGGIENVVFKNISVASNSGSGIANEILLTGWLKENEPTKTIQNISFTNVTVEGKPIMSEKDIKTNNTPANQLVQNIRFSYP